MAHIGIERELRNLPHNMQHDCNSYLLFLPTIHQKEIWMGVCWKVQGTSIKQAFTDRTIPDEMFTTTIFELESLRHIRPVPNISDDINDFEYEITNKFR